MKIRKLRQFLSNALGESFVFPMKNYNMSDTSVEVMIGPVDGVFIHLRDNYSSPVHTSGYGSQMPAEISELVDKIKTAIQGISQEAWVDYFMGMDSVEGIDAWKVKNCRLYQCRIELTGLDWAIDAEGDLVHHETNFNEKHDAISQFRKELEWKENKALDKLMGLQKQVLEVEGELAEIDAVLSESLVAYRRAIAGNFLYGKQVNK